MRVANAVQTGPKIAAPAHRCTPGRFRANLRALVAITVLNGLFGAALGPLSTVGEGQNIVVGERWSTAGSARVMEFVGIAGMTEGPGREIWVADGRMGQVAILDSSGRPLRVLAQRGDGPGEFRGPALMSKRPGGGLAVYDAGRMAIELFDANGRAERRVSLGRTLMNPKGFLVLPGGGFVLSGGFIGNPNSIHQFDADGQLQRSWHPAPRTEDPQASAMVAGGPLFLTRDTLILFSQAAPHQILLYGLDGMLVRRLASDTGLLAPIGDAFIRHEVVNGVPVRSFKWFFPQSRAIYQLHDGRILNVVLLWDEAKTLWEFYSPNGTLLHRAMVPQRYEPHALTRNGDILASYRNPDTEEVLAARLRLTFRQGSSP